VRQLYYQCFAHGWIEKTEREYQKIIRLLTDAREAGLFDFDAIEDRGRDVVMRTCWTSYATDRSLCGLEAEAKAAQRRLWALPEAQRVPPWEWRHGGKQPAAPAERTAAACGSKRYCREMVSCGEARHYLSACGLTGLDGDGDGVPCEALC